MQRVSTNFTLFYKFFIPIFWAVFFGSFVVAVLLLDPPRLMGMRDPVWKIVVGGLYILGLLILWWGLVRLKRVEMDEEFVYVTNYFKHARYPWHNIENVHARDWLLFHPVDITFYDAGYFGKKVTFVPSKTHYRDFRREKAEIFHRFHEE